VTTALRAVAASAPSAAAPVPEARTAASQAATVGVTIRELTKAFGSFVALDAVSLDVRPGEFLTLLGPSGSGKTTLLNIVAGFLRPDRGRLYFGSEEVTQRPIDRRGIGMVFQNYALFPHMSVAGNVGFPLKIRKVRRAEIETRVREALALVRLEALADRGIGTLSGGQRQRVALARAIVFAPQVLLMDEPLSALDKNLREQMQVEIRHLHEKIGTTTIYVTHDQREALTMSDRVAIMNGGRIAQCGTPTEVYEDPASAFVASFIGETTLMPVQMAEGGPQLLDGTRLRTTRPLPPPGAWQLVLRAERLLLPDECPADANRISVRLRDVIYQGDSLLIIAETRDGQAVTLRRPLRTGPAMGLPEKGAMITVGMPPAATVIVRDA